MTPESSNIWRSRLNIHGIIDLDQMAAVLISLIEQIDHQNKIIINIQKQMQSFVSNQNFIEQFHSLEQILSKLSVRVDSIQEAATSSVLNKK
jgi:hypothetical protein